MELYVIRPYICTSIFSHCGAKFSQLFSSNGSDFMSAQGSASLTASPVNRQDKQSMSSPLLAPTLSTCVNLSPLVHVHVLEPLLPLQQSCHVNLLSFFPSKVAGDPELRGHPAQRQLDPINSMPRLFFL